MSLDTLKELSVSGLLALENQIPAIKGLNERLLIDGYDSFVEAVINEVENCVRLLQENPELHFTQTEDQITIQIRNMLVMRNYDAEHDVKHGGHVDLKVKLNDYVFILEAKIYSSYSYLWEGWLQLTTRYASGDFNNKKNAILIYIQEQPNARQIMERWAQYIKSQNPCATITHRKEGKLPIISKHILDKTGLEFEIFHIPVMLYFKPEDKSGRSRKAKLSKN